MSNAVPLYGFGGGGGAALNFSVVGNPQPANPKANTIWVDTDVDITGWIFKATQPENLAEGNVWFLVGTSSPAEFNALKKNGITVYPLSAKQYINGALVDKTAKTYQDGAWADWIVYTYLFKSGEGVASDWTVNKNTNARVNITADYINITNTSSASWDFGLYKKNVVDLTNVNTVAIEAQMDSTPRFSIVANKTTFTNSSDYKGFTAYVNITLRSGRQVYKLDVSNLSGMYYVGLHGAATNAYVYDLWLEG